MCRRRLLTALNWISSQIWVFYSQLHTHPMCQKRKVSGINKQKIGWLGRAWKCNSLIPLGRTLSYPGYNVATRVDPSKRRKCLGFHQMPHIMFQKQLFPGLYGELTASKADHVRQEVKRRNSTENPVKFIKHPVKHHSQSYHITKQTKRKPFSYVATL